MADAPARSQVRWLLAGLLGAFAFPTSSPHIFAGLPFSEPVEFAAFVVLVLPFASASLRRYLRLRFARQSGLVRRALVLIPVVALMAKAGLFLAAPSWGFRGCYASLTSPLETLPCERSFEFPFAPRQMTRVDPAIDFSAANWNLSFVNSTRFNYAPAASGWSLRDRLPFSVEWQASLDSPASAVVEATYVGGGAVVTDGQPAAQLPDSYDGPVTTRFVIPAGRTQLSVRYRFDDRFRTDSGAQPGPGAGIVLRRIAADGSGALLLPAAPAAGVRLAAAAVDVLVGSGLLALLLTIGVAVRRALPALAAGALAVIAVHEASLRYEALISYVRPLFVVTVALVLFATTMRRTRWMVAAYFLTVLVATAHVFEKYPTWDYVAVRSAGDDWLTYESFSRSILETWSLRGGEAVFTMQPLYQYFKFAQRLLFGDGEPAVIIVSFGGALVGVLLLTAAIARAGRTAQAAGLVAGTLAVSLLWARTVLPWFEFGLSEIPTWMALPFVLAMLFMHRGAGQHTCGVILLAASAITRTNHIPALGLMFVAFAMRAWQEGWRRRVVWLSTLFVAILLLPLAHNLFYGGRFVLAIVSSDRPAYLILPLSELAQAAVGGPHGEVLRAQIGYVLGFGSDLAPAALLGIQLLWLACVFVAIRQARWYERILHLVPVAYLAPYVMYEVNNYYPRHIVAGYLAMALMSGLQVWFRQRNSVPGMRSAALHGEGRPSSTR